MKEIEYQFKMGTYRKDNGELIEWVMDMQTGEVETYLVGIVDEDYFELLEKQFNELKKQNPDFLKGCQDRFGEMIFKDINKNNQNK